jgi:hypothetical protein
MSQYLTIAVPVSISAITEIVGRSLDPDMGGSNSFNLFAVNASSIPEPVPIVFDPENPVIPEPPPPIEPQYIVCGAGVSDGFVATAFYFKDHPEALSAAVNADIASRWNNDTELTLEDAETFCNAALMSAADGTRAGVAEMGLVLLL